MDDADVIDSPALATSATPRHAPVAADMEAMDDPISRFESKEVKTETLQVDKPTQVRWPAKPDAPREDKPKPDEKKPDVAKPEDKAKAAEEVNTGKMAPKALREAYDKLKREMKEREAKYNTELETVRKSTAPKNVPDPEKEDLAKRYEALEKRYKETENNLRYRHYEDSEEFKEQYKKPYVEKYQQALAEISELKVTNADGSTRAANDDDFWKIVSIPNNEDALAAAEELFGSATKANFVIGLRKDVRAANAAAEKAKAEFKKNGEQRAVESQKQQQAWESEVKGRWSALNQEGVEAHPEWFKAAEDDAQGAEYLENGFKLADLAFDTDSKLPWEKMLALRSSIRNQAAGFRYQAHLATTRAARIAELEKELAEFKASAPGAGQVKGDKGGEDEDALPALLRAE